MEKTKDNRRVGKKGILDLLFVMVLIFIVAICIFVAFIITNKVNDSGLFDSDATAQQAIAKTQTTVLGFDNLLLILLIGCSIFVIVSTAMVQNHPVMFIFSVILLAIIIMVSGVMSNSFTVFSSNSLIEETANNFPKIRFVMDNFPIYLCFVGFTAIITGYISYGKGGL